MSDFSIEFMAGQKDCQEGLIHKSGKSSAYDRGYSAQYELEQIQTNFCLRGENVNNRQVKTAV